MSEPGTLTVAPYSDRAVDHISSPADDHSAAHSEDGAALPVTSVGDDIIAGNSGWSFGGQTPRSFPTHARRSIPLYEEGHKLVCELSDYFVQDGAICYEIGTSVGELIGKLAHRHRARRGVVWIGIDSVEEMIGSARERNKGANIKFVVSDVTKCEFERCQLIVSYYTLQFTPLASRVQLVRRLYEALAPGSALIMFEKVLSSDALSQDLINSLYIEFKIGQQFDSAEIIAKTRSLKGVMNPLTSEENMQLLTGAGFQHAFPVMKYLSFEGYVAIKTPFGS